MSGIAYVHGPRRDLRRVARAEDIDRLTVEGPGIESLDGLERFTALRTLYLRRVRADRLGAVLRARHLAELTLDEPVGPVDWPAVAALTDLELLVIDLVDRAQAEALAGVALGDLRALQQMDLRLLAGDEPVRLRAGFIGAGSALRLVETNNFVLDAEDLLRLCDLGAQLERVHYMPDPAAPNEPDLRERLPRSVDVVALVARVEPDLGVVMERRDAGGRRRWFLRLRVEDPSDEATTLEIAQRVEDQVAERAPSAVGLVDVEVDDDVVWFSAAERAPLDEVKQALSRPNAGDAHA
jgi:hypothetical protein